MPDLYNAREGLGGRQPGVYLDEEERRQAETLRAYREGREPDYDTFKPYVGDVLVPENQLEGFGKATVDPVISIGEDVGVAGASESDEDEGAVPSEPERVNVPEDGVGVLAEGEEEGPDSVDVPTPNKDSEDESGLFDSDEDNEDNE